MRPGLLLSFFLITMVCQPLFAREWYESYDKGQKAVEQGKCAEGVALMQEALKKNPTPDLAARPYGTFTMEYIPYFYLAKCAIQSGDLDAADKYASLAEKYNIYSSSKAGEFEAIKDKLRARAAANKPIEKKPEQKVATMPQAPPPKPPANVQTPPQQPPHPQVDEQARQQTLIARTLDDADRALADRRYETARNAAERALALDPSNQQAARVLSEIDSREKEENERTHRQDRIDQVRQAMRRGDIMTAESLALQLRADYPSDRTVASLLDELQRKKQAQLKTMEQSDSRKLIERQVVLAYYAGKYEAVIELVDQNSSQYPDSWILHFYEGCAHAALSLLRDKDHDGHLQQARELFHKAKSAPGFVTPPQISPKILDIFQNS